MTRDYPMYGWMPCLACDSMRHYIDDCNDGDAVAAYYNTDDDSEGPVEGRDYEEDNDP